MHYNVKVTINSAANESEETFTIDESSDEEMAEEYWDVEIEDVLRDFDQDDLVQEGTSQSNIVLYMIPIFLLLWRSFYEISATALDHLIQFLHHILSIIAPSSPTVAALLTVFPTSLYMLKFSKMHLRSM